MHLDFFLYDSGLKELKYGYKYSLSSDKKYLSIACSTIIIFDILNNCVIFRKYTGKIIDECLFIDDKLFFRFKYDTREFFIIRKNLKFKIYEYKPRFKLIKSFSPIVFDNHNITVYNNIFNLLRKRSDDYIEKIVFADFLSKFNVIVCFDKGRVLTVDVMPIELKTMLLCKKNSVLELLPLDIFKEIFNLCLKD